MKKHKLTAFFFVVASLLCVSSGTPNRNPEKDIPIRTIIAVNDSDAKIQKAEREASRSFQKRMFVRDSLQSLAQQKIGKNE